jgi:hypothetical protein
LFEELRAEGAETFRQQAEELRGRLIANQHFLSLPERERNRLLTGSHAYPVPTERIGVDAGIEVTIFRVLYRFYSAQLHGFPMSYYRSGEKNRGIGVYNEVEEGYLTTCLHLTNDLLHKSSDEMEALFAPHITR